MSRLAIQDLLKAGESQDREFKRNAANLDAIGASVCAFLNTEGGTLLIGVSDAGRIEPVVDADEKIAAIQSHVQERLSPKALWSVTKEVTPQGEILSVDVPSGQDRPYLFKDRIYLRQGPNSRVAKAEEIRKLVLARAGEPTRWERLAAPGLELTDLDVIEIKTTSDMARKVGASSVRRPPESVTGPIEFEQMLAEWSLWQFGVLTNGAAVLFANNPALRLPQTRIRASRFETDKGGNFIDDRVFEGHAFDVLEQVFSFVRQHVRIEGHFESAGYQREDRPEYPFAALREGIINAIIHRDYESFSGGMAIGIYPHRIEIWNYGRLPDGLRVQDLKKSHPSLPSNPDMAHVFYLRGFIERLGRGTQKIVQECEAAGLPSPTWKVSESGITLTFFGRQSMATTKPLNSRQKALLQRLEPSQIIHPADYYKEMINQISQRQAQRDLTDLEKSGWLKKEGDGPATVYLRTEKEME